MAWQSQGKMFNEGGTVEKGRVEGSQKNITLRYAHTGKWGKRFGRTGSNDHGQTEERGVTLQEISTCGKSRGKGGPRRGLLKPGSRAG